MATIIGTNGFNDQLFGTGADDSIFGGRGDDLLVGDAGNDTLDGGRDNDIMRGGTGDDTYFVDAVGDQVIENPDEGIDTLRSTVDVTLPANVENLVVFGNSPALRRGVGNELNNRIVDESAVIAVDLFGGGGDDVLIGSTRNNLLDGGTGNDTMTGGSGNDTYVVDSAGDVVQEAVDGGIDQVTSSVDHTLADNVEHLILSNDVTQSTAFNGTGNALNNVILGNAFSNTLQGLAGDDNIFGGFGNDTLEGGDGNDNLNGGAGNDTMNGGTGNDTMIGGTGNDVYLVTDAGDVVDEVTGVGAGNLSLSGVDLVRSTVDFILGGNVDNLTLEGTAANGTGNELNNEIIGNNVANVLEGLAGNDVLLGLGGADVLRGGAGNDRMNGGRGNDVMTGGEGADAFIFDLDAPFNRAAIGKDVIRDFTSGVDKIVLDQTTFGNLSRDDFAIVANNQEAAVSEKRIVFSEATSKLFFNTNGTARGFGSGGYFVTLQGALDFALSDITIQP